MHWDTAPPPPPDPRQWAARWQPPRTPAAAAAAVGGTPPPQRDHVVGDCPSEKKRRKQQQQQQQQQHTHRKKKKKKKKHYYCYNFGLDIFPKENNALTPKILLHCITIIGMISTQEENNGVYTINGQQTRTYTFKYNYYWMMGDNRHRSQDSRFWGFVPKPILLARHRLFGLVMIRVRGGTGFLNQFIKKFNPAWPGFFISIK